EGLIRARVDGEIVEVGEEPPKLAKTKAHTIEAVVDRLVVREGIRPRLAESVDRALKLGDGTILLSSQVGDAWEDRVFSTRLACPSCGTGLEEVEPRTFSFNSPHGACPACGGLGVADAEAEEPTPCPACGGSRLRAEARAVTLAGRSIVELCALDAASARAWLEALSFAPPLDLIGPPLVREAASRLGFLDRAGLGYLTLDRAADTLSGGELQRV